MTFFAFSLPVLKGHYMINLNNVRTILQVAGISRLKINFDGDLQIVNAEYIFQGVPGHKQITWEEIIDSLTIGPPEAQALPVAEDNKQLK